jgi:hypothetical protein
VAAAARVIRASPVLDAASGTREVVLQVSSAGGMTPGSAVTVQLGAERRRAQALATRLGRVEVLPALIAIWGYWLAGGQLTTARGVLDCRHRQVDPNPEECVCARQATQHLTGSRAEVHDDGIDGQRERDCLLDHCIDDGATDARLFERRARVNGLFRVARRQRSAILRLQQIDVAAARDVEQVTRRADERALVGRQAQAASAHAAGES